MTLCGCGEPLHYSSPETQAMIERMVEEHGVTVNVVTVEGTWAVPRHYIALHGLKERELPGLASIYGWEKVG